MIWRRWPLRLTSTASRWSSTCRRSATLLATAWDLSRQRPPHLQPRDETGRPGRPFVSINNDTIYSIAQVDGSGGPVQLRVPDTAGRYYVLQFVDAWTNSFAYVGRWACDGPADRCRGTLSVGWLRAGAASGWCGFRLVRLPAGAAPGWCGSRVGVLPGSLPICGQPVAPVLGCIGLCTLTVT
jgi:Protein of unknown function (DUF1254)